MYFDPKGFELAFCIVAGLALYGAFHFVRWLI